MTKSESGGLKFNEMPCDYKKYHPDWKTVIRPAVIERAKNKCEGCGVSNYDSGYRLPILGGTFFMAKSFLNYKEAKGFADKHNENAFGFTPKYIVIVLTVSHTDHNIKNNSMDNLKLLCQKCHNKHDKDYRKHNRKFKGILPIFNNDEINNNI